MNLRALLLLTLSTVSLKGFADTSVIEVGEATLPAHTVASATAPTPFTTIEFNSAFPAGTTPNVFTMTPEFGAGAADDPCLIRIKNITNTGFDATCLEPRNEDRNSPGTVFEYIAINDGTTTIPTTTGGSVVFESQCQDVTRQQFGNQCNNCTLAMGETRGYQTVDFINTFSNPPALLTEIVSTNNILAAGAGIPVGEPEFVSVATTALTSDDFGVAIERLEAGNGLINSAESICYLAVERQGCQTLDLSGINGSESSVKFEATFGGNVDGHGNGATTGEGASFTAACFSGTPVGVADMRVRNGGDGGVIRRESISATEIILTIDEDRISNTERNHIDELVSAFAFGQTFTTPVTLNKVEIGQIGRRVKFEWQTTSESFHLGFHLWGETSAGWVQLNKRLIPGQDRNTENTSEYSKKIRLSRQQYNEIQRFGISSVDSTGFEEFYGPFESGEKYGEENTSEPIDWTETRKQFEQSMLNRGFVNTGKRWRKNSKKLQRRIDRQNNRVLNSALDVRFDGAGVRKLLVSDLLLQQEDWLGKPLSSLAVTLNDKPVARYVVSNDGFISADDVIIFNVVTPQSRDQIYINNNNYRISLNKSKVQNAVMFDGRDTHSLKAAQAVFVEQVPTEGKLYSRVITSGNPWFDSRLLAIGQATSQSYSVNFQQEIVHDNEAQLTISLFGGIDLPGDTPDHHVQVWVNGVQVHDARFDGFVEHRAVVELPKGLLTGLNDTVDVIVPGDTGLFADLVLVDEITLSAPTKLTSEVALNFSPNPEAVVYQLPIIDNQLPRVFAYTESGAFALITPKTVNETLSFRALPYLESVNNPEEFRYTVSDVDELESATSIEPVTVLELHKQETDLLIVAHPSFMGDELNKYVKFKQDEGYIPLVISWLDIVERYGFGNNTPEALNNFLNRARHYYALENLLIVGGHTYDYLDVLGSGVINYIPTHYRRISSAEYGPADNVFADLNNDNIPEFAIGRWPVRSLSDLSAIISKSQSWQTKRKNGNTQRAVLIAQSTDAKNLNFEDSLEGRVVPQLSALSQFSDPVRVYLQQLHVDGALGPVQQARELIADAINSGADLVSFAGHASTSGWGYQGVVNTQFIKSLENVDAPVIVMPLACYTTNYQDLNTNTLAHQWLFAGTQGAAAVHGAAMLGDYRENGLFAERFLKQSRSATHLGQAILNAKRQMAPVNEMLHNWTLLGDPTLLLH